MQDEKQFEQLIMQYTQLKNGSEEIAKMIDFSCASLFIFYESMPKRDKTGIVVIIELYTGFDTMDSSPKLYKSRTRIIGFVFQITERE